MRKKQLIEFLNEFLKISRYQDTSKNWLQVDTTKTEIKKIWYAVDATSYIFDLAIKNQVDLVLVHHWIFWWIENTLTDIYFDRVNKLIKNDIWLYACHLPLDAHPVVWNNIGILVSLINILWNFEKKYKPEDLWAEDGIDKILDTAEWIIFEDEEIIIETFWRYKGIPIGYWLRFKNQPIHWASVVSPFCEMMWFERKFYNFWQKEYLQSFAIVSWGGGEATKEAKVKWYDLFITWEMVHYQICFAKELGQSILLAGHRETEKIWPKLLAYYLKKKFGLDIIFLDEKY